MCVCVFSVSKIETWYHKSGVPFYILISVKHYQGTPLLIVLSMVPQSGVPIVGYQILGLWFPPLVDLEFSIFNLRALLDIHGQIQKFHTFHLPLSRT